MPIESKKNNKGQALITAIIFFLFISTTITLGVANPVLRQLNISNDLVRSKNSYFLSESLSEDLTYRLKTGKQVSASESLTLSGETATALVSDILGGKRIIATGNFSDATRKVQTDLIMGAGVSFSYGVQSGEGGMHIKNTALVSGNVFSNGPVTGENSNLIKGDVISAGPSGSIYKIHATSSAYAHTITDSQIDKNAYYQVISGTTVGGVSYPNSPDQATAALPISDAKITEWENEAALGGTVSCSGSTYNISGSVTIGPKKIPCDLRVDGSDSVTLTGPLWVTGKITVSNSATFRIHSSLGNRSVVVIADDPLNRITSSNIELQNTTSFYGTGQPGSYILFISANQSAEQSGNEEAIEVQNSAQGALLVYAGHGDINLKNSVKIKEVTAYKITLQNSAQVIYETGLANLLFTAGPGGGYTIDEWKETE
ncbi:MAG: hypothetical protein AAB537_01140 [Patescibacteria group bacterium]